MFKKILIGFSLFVVLIIGVLIAIPFFYSIDQFRPQIISAVNQQIRGKVDLGKISLSLFPVVKIKVDGIQVNAPEPFEKEPLASVVSFEFKMPLYALLFAPRASILIHQPKAVLISQGAKSNLSETLPAVSEESSTTASATTSGAPPAVSESLKALPSWLAAPVRAAKFSFVVSDAAVSMEDREAPKGQKTALTALHLSLKNIGIDTPMAIHFSAMTDVAMAGATLRGPVSTDGSVTFKPVEGKNEVSLDLKQDLAGLEIGFAPFFKKETGIPFGTELQGKIVQGQKQIHVDISKLGLVFASVVSQGSMQVKTDAVDPTKGEFKFAYKVENFDIGSFGPLVPLIRDFKLAGKVNVDMKAHGPLMDPFLDIGVNFAGITGSTPELQKPVSDVTGTMAVTGTIKEPSVVIKPFSMKIGASDISAEVETHGILPIEAKIKVNSKLLNVDEILGIQPLVISKESLTAASAEAPVAGAPGGTAGGSAALPILPLDESLVQMAPMVEEQVKNPLLDQVKASVSADVGTITLMGANFTGATFSMTLANRLLNIARTGIGGYGGQVTFDMGLGLFAEKPVTYSMKADLQNVKIGEMLKTHAPSFKDDLTGSLIGNFELSGAGFRREQLEKNLRGILKGDLKDGSFKLPLADIVEQAVAMVPSLGKAESKLNSAAKGKSAAGAFKTCKLNTAIVGRKVKLSLLDIVYDGTKSKLGDLRFSASGQVGFDRDIDLEGIAYVSPELVRIGQLKGKSGKVEIPLKIGGTMDEPKPDYAYTLKALSGRAGEAVLNLAKQKLEEEKKKLEAQLKAKTDEERKKAEAALKAKAVEQGKKLVKNAPAPVKKEADKLLKKFKLK